MSHAQPKTLETTEARGQGGNGSISNKPRTEPSAKSKEGPGSKWGLEDDRSGNGGGDKH